MSVLAPLVTFVLGGYLVAVLEAWSTTGRFRPLAPAISVLALLGKESSMPRKPDRLLFETAPVLLLAAAVLAAAALPLGPSLVFANLATGALFVNAALAYVLVALVMAGWGPDGAYALVGGWRFLGQLIAYSMLLVMPITAVAMRAQSLVTTDIVLSQQGLWNIAYQPLGFALFFLATMAASFLPPFDLPTAGGELAGGVEAEYAGARLAVFRLGRTVLVVSLATATTTFFLGGWLGPGLSPWLWSALKIVAVSAAMLAPGRTLPRLREGRLMASSWKLGIPLALLNILLVGVLLLRWD